MWLLNCKIGTLARIIATIKEKKGQTIIQISLRSRISYPQTSKIINELSKIGLIRIKKTKRDKNIYPTKKLDTLRLFEYDKNVK